MQTPGTGHITTVEAPLPLSSLKLVYPLPDPVTGIPRDVVLNKVVKRNAAFDPYRNTTTWSRYLSPQNVLIPWPEESEPAYSDEKADTLRIDVEAKTFLPTLLRPPMPGSVIDELRNKYSKFRERHDESWLELRRQEDEEQKRLDELSGKLMPKGARNIARKHPSTSGGAFMADKKAVPRLREPLLRAIGDHMANKQMEKIRRDLVQ
jgi:large subunit ribosomal protein L24